MLPGVSVAGAAVVEEEEERCHHQAPVGHVNMSGVRAQTHLLRSPDERPTRLFRNAAACRRYFPPPFSAP